MQPIFLDKEHNDASWTQWIQGLIDAGRGSVRMDVEHARLISVSGSLVPRGSVMTKQTVTFTSECGQEYVMDASELSFNGVSLAPAMNPRSKVPAGWRSS